MKIFFLVSALLHTALFGLAAWKVGVFAKPQESLEGQLPNYPVDVVSIGARIEAQRKAVAQAQKTEKAGAPQVAQVAQQIGATPVAAAVQNSANAVAPGSVLLEEASGEFTANTQLTIADYAAYVRRNNPQPDYPRAARIRGEKGRVIVRVTVQPNGVASSIEVDPSSGVDSLDGAALEAVRTWRFPRFKNLTELVLRIPFRFDLE